MILSSSSMAADAACAGLLAIATFMVQQTPSEIATAITGSAIALSALIITLTTRLRSIGRYQKVAEAARKDRDQAQLRALEQHTHALAELLKRREGGGKNEKD